MTDFNGFNGRYVDRGLVYWEPPKPDYKGDMQIGRAYFIFPYEHMPPHVHVMGFATEDDLLEALGEERLSARNKGARKREIPEIAVNIWAMPRDSKKTYLPSQQEYHMELDSKIQNRNTKALKALLGGEKNMSIFKESAFQFVADNIGELYERFCAQEREEGHTHANNEDRMRQLELLPIVQRWLQTHTPEVIVRQQP